MPNGGGGFVPNFENEIISELYLGEAVVGGKGPVVNEDVVSLSDSTGNKGMVESDSEGARGMVDSNSDGNKGMVESDSEGARGMVESNSDGNKGMVE